MDAWPLTCRNKKSRRLDMRWVLALISSLSLLVSGCSVPTGSASLYHAEPDRESETVRSDRVQAMKKAIDKNQSADNTETRKAVIDAANNVINVRPRPLSPDVFARDTSQAIRKGGHGIEGDVFSIYLSDAYFKYLKDWGGVNEVLIIAEFEEVIGGKKEKFTSVLGPYLGVADKSHPPSLNKLLYGPKRLDSDHLSIKLTVLEYDQGENADTAALLDFVHSLSETFSLANPVTATQITFAKEVAKSLLALNKDDVVMHINMDMVANTGDAVDPKNGSLLPLNPGNYVFINQEHCAPANCFMYLTEGGTRWNPVAWLGDALMLAPTAIRRGLADTADAAALEDVDPTTLTFQNHVLTTQTNTVAGLKTAPFKDKTWLALSIHKGGDASSWESRKLLMQAEKQVQEINTQTKLNDRKNAYQSAQQFLAAAQQADLVLETGINFVSPKSEDGTFALTTTSKSFCMSHARPVKEPVFTFYKSPLAATDSPEKVSNISRDKDKSDDSLSCFNVTPAPLAPGHYEILMSFISGKKTVSQRIPFAVAQ